MAVSQKSLVVRHVKTSNEIRLQTNKHFLPHLTDSFLANLLIGGWACCNAVNNHILADAHFCLQSGVSFRFASDEIKARLEG